MCSIYGSVGHVDESVFRLIQSAAKDRGRDGGRVEYYVTFDGLPVSLGNWRAVPTPEIEEAELQPYQGMVHNGTISNDVELGLRPGEVDSQVISRVLLRDSVEVFVGSLDKVIGSYALACFNGRTVLAATNYKPLYYSVIGQTLYFSSMSRHFDDVLEFGHAPAVLSPYTAIDFRTHQRVELRQIDSKKVVVIASSGLDSTVAATQLVRSGWDVCLLHFSYGCVAGDRESIAIKSIAESLGCSFFILYVDLSRMLGLGSSTLFGDGHSIVSQIQGAEFCHEWVPGRNLVFISLAVAWAEANGYHAVALGNNLEEAGAYPDNEEEFTNLLNKAVSYAVRPHYKMRLLSPVGNLMKHEIVSLGIQLNAPFGLTWSCYRGGKNHCGNCGPCFMRKKAFERNGASDPVFMGV